MSPVSTVFHTVVTVRLGLETKLGNIHSIELDVYVGWQSTQLSSLIQPTFQPQPQLDLEKVT